MEATWKSGIRTSGWQAGLAKGKKISLVSCGAAAINIVNSVRASRVDRSVKRQGYQQAASLLLSICVGGTWFTNVYSNFGCCIDAGIRLVLGASQFKKILSLPK